MKDKKKIFKDFLDYYDYNDDDIDFDLSEWPADEWDAEEEFDRLISEGGKTECDHKWTLYQGLINSFEYCCKCDIKREDIENL